MTYFVFCSMVCWITDKLLYILQSDTEMSLIWVKSLFSYQTGNLTCIVSGPVIGRNVFLCVYSRSAELFYETNVNKRLGVPFLPIVYYLLCELNGNWVFAVEAVSCSLHRMCIFSSMPPPSINGWKVEMLFFIFSFYVSVTDCFWLLVILQFLSTTEELYFGSTMYDCCVSYQIMYFVCFLTTFLTEWRTFHWFVWFRLCRHCFTAKPLDPSFLYMVW